MIRLVLIGSAVTMVLNAWSINIYTHLEIWLVRKTESIEAGTVLANKAATADNFTY